ncbi:MAG TPA: DUF3786 domain-containing protein [Desulfomonilaceae bacterium]|nr:DUF3786 domain-containing protein [Desulfomonilaceae bacterium]
MPPPDEYTMWLEREKTGKNVDELQGMYDELIRKVKRIDPLTIAETCEAAYKSDGIPRVVIPFLHSWFVLEFVPYRIRAEHEPVDTLAMKVLVLQHFIAAAENLGTAVRVMGQWIDIRTLRHGSVMGAHFAKKTSDLLGKFFSLEKETKISRVLQWGGRPIDLGDEGYLFKFFPRLPVAFVYWTQDEEFAPYSKILYDVSASNYMPTHGLAALTEFLIHRLAD